MPKPNRRLSGETGSTPGMEVSDARRLKKLLTDSMLDVATLKEALGKF